MFDTDNILPTISIASAFVSVSLAVIAVFMSCTANDSLAVIECDGKVVSVVGFGRDRKEYGLTFSDADLAVRHATPFHIVLHGNDAYVSFPAIGDDNPNTPLRWPARDDG